MTNTERMKYENKHRDCTADKKTNQQPGAVKKTYQGNNNLKELRMQKYSSKVLKTVTQNCTQVQVLIATFHL